MSRLLDEFEVKWFWRPGGLSAKELRLLLQAQTVDAERAGSGDQLNSVQELERIFSAVGEHSSRNRRPEQKPRPRIKKASVWQQLFPVPAGDSSECQIFSVAPSGDCVNEYNRELVNAFENQRLKTPLPDSSHNKISIGLVIEFGLTRVILGGDIEIASWRRVREQVARAKLSAHVVKVSHHGSVNGYCDGLWDDFAASQPPIALLTAYRSRRLPRRIAIQHIKEHAPHVYSTNQAACKPTTETIELDMVSQLAMRSSFRDLHVATENWGRLTYILNDQGEVLALEVVQSAGELDLSFGFD
jgi:hypothetical protein